MTDWNLPPLEIEKRSFEIIDREAGDHGWAPDAWSIVRRMIHTTADFDFVTTVRMHGSAVEKGIEALKAGAAIFCDTNMCRSGISKARLAPYGCKVECLITDEKVKAIAEKNNMTRAAAAVDAALPELDGAIYVVGNAPTALFRLMEVIGSGKAAPALVVGLPVGFVNAAESKEELSRMDYPHITALGRKGGSALAASVINALAVLCGTRSDTND